MPVCALVKRIYFISCQSITFKVLPVLPAPAQLAPTVTASVTFLYWLFKLVAFSYKYKPLASPVHGVALDMGVYFPAVKVAGTVTPAPAPAVVAEPNVRALTVPAVMVPVEPELRYAQYVCTPSLYAK
jgi:hypothetical protein